MGRTKAEIITMNVFESKTVNYILGSLSPPEVEPVYFLVAIVTSNKTRELHLCQMECSAI